MKNIIALCIEYGLKFLLFLILLVLYLKHISILENIISVVLSVVLSVPIIGIVFPLISIFVVDRVLGLFVRKSK